MSLVSVENNWTRPEMSDNGQLVIRDGRHPLQELSSSQFIPNDTEMGQDRGSVHIVTGPNSSGKSVYLKQVGLIVYLAHLGCFVPATQATVPITDKIFTRILTLESVSLGISSFACDLQQVSAAVRSFSPRSLLLLDEFGKGTNSIDGEALLASVIKFLVDSSPPLTLVSTHFHNVRSLLGDLSECRYFVMDTKRRDD